LIAARLSRSFCTMVMMVTENPADALASGVADNYADICYSACRKLLPNKGLD